MVMAMKRVFNIFALCLLTLAAVSCAKADDEGYVHDECKIRSAYIKTLVPGSADMVNGVIDESVEPAEIVFKILRPKWDLYDLERIKVRVGVTYDVMVEPSLSGRTLDLSDYDEPYPITVRNTVTGETRTYNIRAYKSVDLN